MKRIAVGGVVIFLIIFIPELQINSQDVHAGKWFWNIESKFKEGGGESFKVRTIPNSLFFKYKGLLFLYDLYDCSSSNSKRYSLPRVYMLIKNSEKLTPSKAKEIISGQFETFYFRSKTQPMNRDDRRDWQKENKIPTVNKIVKWILNSQKSFFKKLKAGKYNFEKNGFRVVNSLSVYLKLEPRGSSHIIGKVTKGEAVLLLKNSGKKVTIDNKQGFWVKIVSSKGTNGYIFSCYLSKFRIFDLHYK